MKRKKYLVSIQTTCLLFQVSRKQFVIQDVLPFLFDDDHRLRFIDIVYFHAYKTYAALRDKPYAQSPVSTAQRTCTDLMSSIQLSEY